MAKFLKFNDLADKFAKKKSDTTSCIADPKLPGKPGGGVGGGVPPVGPPEPGDPEPKPSGYWGDDYAFTSMSCESTTCTSCYDEYRLNEDLVTERYIQSWCCTWSAYNPPSQYPACLPNSPEAHGKGTKDGEHPPRDSNGDPEDDLPLEPLPETTSDDGELPLEPIPENNSDDGELPIEPLPENNGNSDNEDPALTLPVVGND